MWLTPTVTTCFKFTWKILFILFFFSFYIWIANIKVDKNQQTENWKKYHPISFLYVSHYGTAQFCLVLPYCLTFSWNTLIATNIILHITNNQKFETNFYRFVQVCCYSFICVILIIFRSVNWGKRRMKLDHWPQISIGETPLPFFFPFFLSFFVLFLSMFHLKAYSLISYRGCSQNCQKFKFIASICSSPLSSTYPQRN